MTPRPLEGSVSRLFTHASQDRLVAQSCGDLSGPSSGCQEAGLHPEALPRFLPKGGGGRYRPSPPPPPGPYRVGSTCSGTPNPSAPASHPVLKIGGSERYQDQRFHRPGAGSENGAEFSGSSRACGGGRIRGHGCGCLAQSRSSVTGMMMVTKVAMAVPLLCVSCPPSLDRTVSPELLPGWGWGGGSSH